MSNCVAPIFYSRIVLGMSCITLVMRVMKKDKVVDIKFSDIMEIM